jgi:WD40 repeat protein
MAKELKRKSKKALLFLTLPVAILMLVLSYYQLFYKSKRVDNGMVQPGIIFTVHTAQLRGVRFDPLGNFVVSGSVDSTVRIWKKENGEQIRILKHPAGVSSVVISNNGKYIATGSYDSVVRLWRVEDGLLVQAFTGHRGTVWSVDISTDGKTIASSGDDATAMVWDIQTGKRTHTLRGHTRTVWSVKISPDRSKIVTVSYDASIKLWNAANGNLSQTLDGHSEAIVDVSFSNDGQMFASTSDDKTIKLWNTADLSVVRIMKVEEHVQAVVFSPDNQRLLTGGRDKPMPGEFLQEIFGDSKFNKGVSMRLWDVRSGKLLQTFTDHLNDVNDVAYSNDGLWIASASDDKTVRLYKVVR